MTERWRVSSIKAKTLFMKFKPGCHTGATIVIFMATLISALSTLNAHGDWGTWHDPFDGSTIFYSESYPGLRVQGPGYIEEGRVYYACRKGEGEWAFIYFGDGMADADGTWFRRDGPGQPLGYRTKWDKDTATLPFTWVERNKSKAMMFYDDADAINRILHHWMLTVEFFWRSESGSEGKAIIRYTIGEMKNDIPRLRQRCELPAEES